MMLRAHLAVSIMVAFAYLMPVVLCTILRLPCMTIADFTITEHGKRLTGSVISRHYDTTDVQCMILCIQNGKCRSYNMQRTKLICELNGNSLADNGAKLSDDIEWLYRSTNYSSPLVGPTCKKLRPCEKGILCRDTCSPPYFECVYCDNKHTGLHCDIEKEINECGKNPCQNAGACVDKKVGYKCICKSGFTGQNCENDVNECDSLPCFNGGACQNYPGGYNCTCAIGYFGAHCDGIN